MTKIVNHWIGGLAADPVVDDLRHDRLLLHRWRRRVETCRSYSSRALTADGRVAVSATGTSHQACAGGGPDTVSAVWVST